MTGHADNVLTDVYSDHLIAEYFYELPDKVRFYTFYHPYDIMMLILTLTQKKFPQYYRVTGLPISLNMIKVRITCIPTKRHSKFNSSTNNPLAESSPLIFVEELR